MAIVAVINFSVPLGFQEKRSGVVFYLNSTIQDRFQQISSNFKG